MATTKTPKHRWHKSTKTLATTCTTCGASQATVGADSTCLAARHSDPAIEKLYRARRRASLAADWGGTSRKRSQGWADAESIARELRRLDPFGAWYFEGDRHDGRGWVVDVPEWNVYRYSDSEGWWISRAEDYAQAESDAALLNAQRYGSALVVRNFDPDGSGARLVVWHSQTGEWSPLADAPTEPPAPACTCHVEETGDGESGPSISVTPDESCPLHGREADPEPWEEGDRFERGYIASSLKGLLPGVDFDDERAQEIVRDALDEIEVERAGEEDDGHDLDRAISRAAERIRANA